MTTDFVFGEPDTTRAPLPAPMPYFGSKRSIASEVWKRFGDPKKYVEPFFGSGAVLLARPTRPQIETVNDMDQYVANFWRAVRHDPDSVADHADWPVNESDLAARHYWLVTVGKERLVRIMGDADAFDAQIAGRWLWGACAWIGTGWCSGAGPWQWLSDAWVRKLPHVGDAGRGINRQLPHVSTTGMGINRQLPHVGDAGMGGGRRRFIFDWIYSLTDRLRDTRIACGDWTRVLGAAATTRRGMTAVFLDPPYSDKERCGAIYSVDDMTTAHAVREWALANGGDPKLRIALCGYDGEHAMPADWETLPWKAKGGYGSQGDGKGRNNASRETIWFSPGCLRIPSPSETGSAPSADENARLLAALLA